MMSLGWLFVKYWFSDFSRNICRVIFKLVTVNQSQKRNKMIPVVLLPWQQFCFLPVLSTNWNSRVFSFLRIVYSPKSTEEPLDWMGTLSAPSWALCPTFKGVKLFLGREGLGAKQVSMETNLQVSFCLLFHLHLLGQVLRVPHINIFIDITKSVFNRFNWVNLMMSSRC